ncbi:MAG: MFS transporter [Alphaproteobacteria bacterium]|nr:MFS transporter [Alphaproteobacteria bacterium]
MIRPGALTRPGAPAFMVLLAFDALARATLSAIVPLQAYDLLGSAQKVSVIYFAIASVGLLGSLSVPWLVIRLRRRWTLLLGSSCLIAAPALFSVYALPAFVPALALQMFGGASVTICVNLYILEHVARRDLMRFEPVRVMFTGAGWMIGPALGVYLHSWGADWLPYLVSGIFALTLIVYFWSLRAPRAVGSLAATVPQANPVKFVRRYFAQPRLTLAWLLAVGRAGWWGMFYVYGPIYAVSSGLGKEAGGLIVSAGASALFTVMLWGWIGRKVGIRRILIVGYALAGTLTLSIGFASGHPWLAAGFIVAAALGVSIADGAGNVPFLRAVHSYERAEMTAFYTTYRDMARLSMPALYSVLLLVFPLSAVFFASGTIMLALSFFARYIPRSLGQDRRR